MTWILQNKRWAVIIILSILYVIQIAYTNHLSKKLNEAAAECTSKIQKIEQAQQKALIDQQNKANEVSADYEAAKAEQQSKSQVIYKAVEKIVDRPIYRNVCIDDDGRMLINQAVSGQTNNTE